MLNRYVLLGPIQENANDADWRNSTPSGEQVRLPLPRYGGDSFPSPAFLLGAAGKLVDTCDRPIGQ